MTTPVIQRVKEAGLEISLAGGATFLHVHQRVPGGRVSCFTFAWAHGIPIIEVWAETDDGRRWLYAELPRAAFSVFYYAPEESNQ